MKKKNLKKINKYAKWITPSFIILFLTIQAFSYFYYAPKFKNEKIRITIAEVYNVDIVKSTVYADYVYKVDSKLYKSGTGGENGGEFRDWKLPELRKYPVVYNIDNPKINFLLSKHRLSDTLKIGIELKNVYLDNKSLGKRMMAQTVQKAYDDSKYLKEYIDLKKID